jgi:hypothetical protein
MNTIIRYLIIPMLILVGCTSNPDTFSTNSGKISASSTSTSEVANSTPTAIAQSTEMIPARDLRLLSLISPFSLLEIEIYAVYSDFQGRSQRYDSTRTL